LQSAILWQSRTCIAIGKFPGLKSHQSKPKALNNIFLHIFILKYAQGEFVLKLIEEMSYDLDFNEPKIIISEKLAVIENVKAIVMISENSLTVQCGKKHVTVTGSDFVIKEIFEGRLLIEGRIQGIEFFSSSGKDKN